MANKRNIFSSLIVVCSLPTLYGLRPFVMDFETLKYEFNTDIMKSTTLKLINYNSHQALNGSYVFLEDSSEGNVVHWLTATVFNGKPRIIYNVTLNGCEFLSNSWRKMNIFSNAIIQEIIQHMPGLPKTCPLKKNVEYPLLNFYLNEEVFPPYMPDVNFSAFVGVTRKNVYAIKMFTTGYVAAKNGKNYRNRTVQST